MSKDQLEALKKLREPFPANQISKLPKPTIPNDQYKKLQREQCRICGGYHPKQATIHLDYVGHAALTDRLLDVDLTWSWKPFALDEHGLPLLDKNGGLWINLTICGITRPGYGNAPVSNFKDPGDIVKEIIGDALRNAGMRFGMALELWHKGDLHKEEPVETESSQEPQKQSKQTSDAPKTKPNYPDANFETNLPKWEKSIMSGKINASEVVMTVSKTYLLSETQLNKLDDIQTKYDEAKNASQ